MYQKGEDERGENLTLLVSLIPRGRKVGMSYLYESVTPLCNCRCLTYLVEEGDEKGYCILAQVNKC